MTMSSWQVTGNEHMDVSKSNHFNLWFLQDNEVITV